MKKFLGIFLKAYGTTLLIATSISNFMTIRGAISIVATLLNITLIISIWFPME